MSTDLTCGQIDSSANAPLVPTVHDLTSEQKRVVFRETVKQRLVREMDREIEAASSDVRELVEDFLKTRKSDATRRLYRYCITRWLAWCDSQGVHPILATAKDADLFAAQLEGKPATVNAIISGVSSWYAVLYKWGKIARTPFVRIARRADDVKSHPIPTAKEVRVILEACR